MRRPLAPSLPETPAGTPDPVKALADRQRQAIDKRVQGAERARIEGAGVDGAPTPPKAGKTGSPPASQPKPTSTGGSQGSASAASAAKPQPSTATSSNTAGSASEPAAQPSTEGASTPSPSSDTTDEPGEGEQSTPATADASNAKRGPRYELKAFKKWTEENPEQAAELAKAVFQIDVGEGFIKLQNKARKIKGDIRERQIAAETAAQTKLAAAEAAKTHAEQVAQQLRPMADMWAAAQRKDERGQPVIDFDTADECFRLNMGGVTVDEYMRQRARRGIAHPELARERAARLRVEAELAQLKGGKTTNGAEPPHAANGAAGTAGGSPAAKAASQPAPAALAAPSIDWGEEIAQDHQLRQFAGWEKDLAAEMRKHHDETLDEYSADPEEMADKVLQRRLAAFAPAENEPAPAARKRPNTPKRRAAAPDGVPDPSELTPRTSRQQPPPPKGHRPATADDLDDAGPADMAQRERWALQRAQRRLMGEQL